MDGKVKVRYRIHGADIVCAATSVLLGCVNHPIGIGFVFLYVSYCYLCSVRKTCISIFFILLCSLVRGVLPAYFYALGFAVYFVVIQIWKLRNRNLYVALPYITFCMVAIYSFQVNRLQAIVLVAPLMCFVIMQEMLADVGWIQKNSGLPSQIKAIMVVVIALVLAQLFPIYANVVLLVALLNVVYVSDVKTSIALLMGAGLLLVVHPLALLLYAGMLAIYKDKKGMCIVMALVAAGMLAEGVEDAIYILISVIGLFVIPQVHRNHQVDCIQLDATHVMKRQMNNYAGIFEQLAQYYERVSDVQSELLSNMALSLQYSAQVISKVQGNEKDCEHIKRSLEGYQYIVKTLHIEEPKEGFIHIELELSNIKRGEIRTTLQPLMEVLLQRKLEIEEVQSHRLSNRMHRITMVDRVPYKIDAYADSIKNAYASNGDSFSIFRFRQSVVCMISDGMGNGEQAKKSSTLITNIFQRMMVCGIAQDNAIRCINRLIQSDAFATLDVLCFNKAQGVVYISKSAACPTFLLREGQVHEIMGNALPVGIVTQMQPDCFQIQYQAHDAYIMVSDGIQMEEIQEWLHNREDKNAKEEVAAFATLLKKRVREDDSTLVVIKIDEIT